MGLLDWFSAEHCVRDILYLDISLEEFLRVVVERNLHHGFERDELIELVGMAAENTSFSQNTDELSNCATHWRRMQQIPSEDTAWSLQARSVTERMALVSEATSSSDTVKVTL